MAKHLPQTNLLNGTTRPHSISGGSGLVYGNLSLFQAFFQNKRPFNSHRMAARIFLLIALLDLLSLSLVPSCRVHRRALNRIDSLVNDEDVLYFVRKTSDYPSLRFQLPTGKDSFGIAFWKRYRQRFDSFGARPYEKVDLDNNGLTDLVFTGYDSLYRGPLSVVVLSFEKDSFSTHILPMGNNPQFFAAKTIHIDGQPFLQTVTEKLVGRNNLLQKDRQQFLIDGYYYQRWCDTLDWSLSCPVERWPHRPQTIDTLRYDYTGGLGFFVLFQMTVINDSLHLSKTGDSSPKTTIDSNTIFVGKLDIGSRRRLNALLAQIDWQRVDSSYEAGPSDEPFGYMEISYDKHKRKIIRDDGCRGTFGLAALENMLYDFLKSQSWKPVHSDQPTYKYEKQLSEFVIH
jgi:hypothetical protein